MYDKKKLQNPTIEIEKEEIGNQDLILDRYQILKELASTQFSIVYKALDTKMQRLVAIKMIKGPSKATTWAKREAHLSAKLNHPSICTIYEYEEVDNAHLLIMEYLQGLTLREVLSFCKTLEIDEAVSIVKEISIALEYAHLNYVVHKDIKPENVMLLSDGRLKIMDFGTGRLLDQASEESKSLIGTPAYMSPEQIRREHLDDRTDQFSLAVVMYEMLSSKSPFDAKSNAQTINKVENEDVESLDNKNEEVSEVLAAVISKALSKDPQNRYSTMTDFRYKMDRAYLPSASSREIISSLVERCSSTSLDIGVSRNNSITGGIKSFVGRIYKRNKNLINRIFTASAVATLALIVSAKIGFGINVIVSTLLGGVSLFLPTIGLVGLSLVASTTLFLQGFTYHALILVVSIFIWVFALKRRNKFEISFSVTAPILTYAKLSIIFPIFSAIAFSPAKASFVSFLGAAQVLLLSGLFRNNFKVIFTPLELSQLVTWPIVSLFVSLVMKKKTLTRAMVSSSLAVLLLISTIFVLGSAQSENLEIALKSASLSLIITLAVLPLVPFERNDNDNDNDEDDRE